ncbi:L,D-transpeptidase [Leisingera sp. HS039]|uniref:L,D-transpeptidase n=1 Tax=Leisingera sp. HS039 TaxID=2818496 RepID=UPI001B3A163A|nr:L,D-transpeptidase [Leisingera sp. HS039]MBQ4823846.1 L,D-transpeptidase [Leisingera sp. HS039]
MLRRDFIAGAGALTVLGSKGSAHTPTLPVYDMPEELLPREVRIQNDLTPYEVHVDPEQFALYWTLPEGRAIRFAVGVGRPGLYEAGEFYVGAKKVWPSWKPTPDMIRREPHRYARFADGMPGGLGNPLGSRALYLFQPGRGDTFLRIHGTNEPDTIGRRVSNGCARLVNDQMINLYDRVPLDTRVVLHPVVNLPT